MNQEIVKGKIQSLKGETKIWVGKKTGNKAVELEGNKDKLVGKLKEQNGKGKEKVEKELKHVTKAKQDFRNKSENFISQLQKDFNELTKEEIKSVEGNLEALTAKIQEKYRINTVEAQKKLNQFLSGMYESKV